MAGQAEKFLGPADIHGGEAGVALSEGVFGLEGEEGLERSPGGSGHHAQGRLRKSCGPRGLEGDGFGIGQPFFQVEGLAGGIFELEGEKFRSAEGIDAKDAEVFAGKVR